ncbi:hypothetical protein [Nocardia sp. NPDC060249]|uniref:hypothetical protein n=1 Tax=Nocardia sp. NPDC060249 TaxID=3347082 RepID=UPI003648012F
MLAALAPVRTRVVLARAALLDAMEHADSPTVVLHTTCAGTVSVTASSSWTERALTGTGTTGDFVAQEISSTAAAGREAPEPGAAQHIPQARATGPAMAIHFAVTTLYPAVATAVGPDVMLDLIAPDQPVLIRSADDGDLSTLAMPCKPEPAEETSR